MFSLQPEHAGASIFDFKVKQGWHNLFNRFFELFTAMPRTSLYNYRLEFDQAEFSLQQINTRKHKLTDRIIALRARIQKVFSAVENSNERLTQMGQKLEAFRKKDS
jgi:peptidoglycan hydrolase CwlO-like protein